MLFKGLVPTLVSIIPAHFINFFTYRNEKQVITDWFNSRHENSYVHLCTSTMVGITTSTTINLIWVIKMCLQLSAADNLKSSSNNDGAGSAEVIIHWQWHHLF